MKLIVYDIHTQKFVPDDLDNSYESLDPGDTRVHYDDEFTKVLSAIRCVEFISGYAYRGVDLMVIDSHPAGYFIE